MHVPINNNLWQSKHITILAKKKTTQQKQQQQKTKINQKTKQNEKNKKGWDTVKTKFLP